MTMAPVLPGVSGDAKRVADALDKRKYNVLAEITARIGGFGLLASVLHAASSASVQKIACGGLGAGIRADERRTPPLDAVQYTSPARNAVAAKMQDAHELRCGSVAAAERAYALGYASVALETICDATRASDATPLDWGEPRDVDAPSTTPRLRLLKRLTVRLDAPRMSVPQKVLNAFDLVAVVPETDDAFRAACASSDVDLISVACGARLPFAVARKDVEVAIKRGAAFEVSYAHSIGQPRSLRHLTATGLRLAALTNGGRGLVLSCGSSDAWRMRSPLDVGALASMLGVRKTDGVVGASAARAVAAGAARLYAAGADDSWLDGDEIKQLIGGARPSGKRRRRK